MKRGLITVAAALVALSTSTIGQAFASTTTGTNTNETYVVHAGDTLYRIAVSKNLSLSALLAVNPQIQNMANIAIGQIINLPLLPYTVQPGDTLYKIAAKQGVSLATLEKVNPQITDVTNILPGETIYIPTSVAGSQVESTASPGTSSVSPASAVTPSASTPSALTGLASTSSGVTAPASTSSSVATSASTASSVATSAAGNTQVSLPDVRQSILSTAQSLIGVPYVWGGQTSAGFDCSGFVEYVFGKNGIVLPRESHDQAIVGVSVSQNAVQPGDLLFFKDTDSSASLYPNHVTHVGIYMGNGNMIESSSSHNNEGVVIVHNVFANPYYVAHYYGARDVIH